MIIVDPVTKEVITGASRDYSHPLKHAVMLCLDQLASGQGGGAWYKTTPTANRVEPTADKLEGPPTKRSKLQYLCTGYDAFCASEPCIM